MKIKELIDMLKSQEGEREIVLHSYNHHKGESDFIPLEFSCYPHANTTNLFVLIEGHSKIEPIRVKKNGQRRNERFGKSICFCCDPCVFNMDCDCGDIMNTQWLIDKGDYKKYSELYPNDVREYLKES